ncbi:MAG: methyltransferase [Nitrospinaceae bacterium]
MLRRENYDEYSNLIEVIRNGRKVSGDAPADDPEWRRQFTFAMHERSAPRASKVARHILKKKAGRLLDLGCGPGSYAAAILKRDKMAEATLLDRSAALEVAAELWQDTPLWKRIQTVPGDLFKTPFGQGYDTVLFSNILHIYNDRQNRTLLKKIHKALNPGGRVVLVDYFLTEDRTGPYQASLFSLTMLLFTETGRTYTWKETEALLQQTGYSRLRRIALKDDSGLLIGHKA